MTVINVYRILIGKPKGKTLLARPRHRWVDNIRSSKLVHLAQIRVQWQDLVNTVLNLRFHKRLGI
jgi:hypothetical protein